MRVALSRQCARQLPKLAHAYLPRQIGRFAYRLFPNWFPNGLITTRHALSISTPPFRSEQNDEAQESPQDETIFALSTASGKAAIAVIRISGPACLHIYRRLCPSKASPEHRAAIVRTLYDPAENPNRDSKLDSNAIILYFQSPHTVTGEDVLEMHVHGGPAIVKAVLQAIPRCSNPKYKIRYAEPGEFTRRAFLNNKLDLTQVEALGDTLSAATEQQRKLSIRGTSNRLAKQYEAWRTQLLYARGELEALIDFSEDQHFDESPAALASSVATQVRVLRKHITTHITNAVRGELLRNGISIALLGPPNAGKSSLLNRIVGREAAIVSREAGTTRDVVEVGIDLGGYLCRIGDMAGLRTNQPDENEAAPIGLVEEEGIKRAKQRALESDVVILVFPLEEQPDNTVSLLLAQEIIDAAKECVRRGSRVEAVVNKVDLLPAIQAEACLEQVRKILHTNFASPHAIEVYGISCKLDQPANGISGFLAGLISAFEQMTSALSAPGTGDASVWQESLSASERHRLLLEDCLRHLDLFLSQVAIDDSKAEEDLDVVVAAESLRAAADCLARITGRGEAGDVEEVLGVVFEKYGFYNALQSVEYNTLNNRRFCVGK